MADIDKFKKTKFWSIIFPFFIGGSIVAAITIWFYESIRIPTLERNLAIAETLSKKYEDELNIIKGQFEQRNEDFQKLNAQVSLMDSSSQLTKEKLEFVTKDLNSSKEQNSLLSEGLAKKNSEIAELKGKLAVITEKEREIAIKKSLSDLRAKVEIVQDHIRANIKKIELNNLALINNSMYHFTNECISKKGNSKEVFYLLGVYIKFINYIKAINLLCVKTIFEDYMKTISESQEITLEKFLEISRKDINIVKEVEKITTDILKDEKSEGWIDRNLKILKEFYDKY